jgi:hypothetical protein
MANAYDPSDLIAERLEVVDPLGEEFSGTATATKMA